MSIHSRFEALREEAVSIARSGLIEARVTISPEGVTFHGPLTFDEDIVAEEGAWFHPIDPEDAEAVELALCDTYRALYDDWVDTKRFPDAPLRDKPRKRRLYPEGSHTPCPALWAGR